VRMGGGGRVSAAALVEEGQTQSPNKSSRAKVNQNVRS